MTGRTATPLLSRPIRRSILVLLLAMGSAGLALDWVQQAYVKSFSTQPGGRFAASVSISGDTLVAGAPFEDNAGQVQAQNSGAAHVYVRSNTEWSHQASLAAPSPEPNDRFGHSVAISGDTIVVGAPSEDTPGVTPADNNSGSAFVFVRAGGVWSLQATFNAPTRVTEDKYGHSVAIEGDTILVSAPWRDAAFSDSGAVYVYSRSGTTWTLQGTLQPSPVATGLLLGSGGVAISGDRAVAATPHENTTAASSGAVYSYTRTGTTWAFTVRIKSASPTLGELFGTSVAISGTTFITGATYEDSVATDSGAAFVYLWNGSAWAPQQTLKASNAGLDDHFGSSVAIDGDRAVVGAVDEDSSGLPGDDSMSAAGAAYVFTRSGVTWTEDDYLKGASPDPGDHFGASAAIQGRWILVGSPDEDSAATGVDGDPANDSSLESGAAFVLVRPDPPRTPQAPDPIQVDPAGATIATGSSTHTGFVARAGVFHGDGYEIGLQIEVKLISEAFDQTTDLFEGEPVPSGSIAEVAVPAASLPPGSYHWQVRSRGPYSDSTWVSYGGNSDGTPPGVPAAVDIIATPNALPIDTGVLQLRSSDGQVLGVGQLLLEGQQVRVEVTWTDGDSDDVRVEVEVALVGTAFLDQPTVSGLPAATGQAATCTLPLLANGLYHWQYQILDEAGQGPGWTDFGGNLPSEADFLVTGSGSQNDADSCLNGVVAAPSAWMLLAALLVAGGCRRAMAR